MVGQPIKKFIDSSIMCWFCRKLIHINCGITYTVCSTTKIKKHFTKAIADSKEDFKICYDCLGSKYLVDLVNSIKRQLTSNSSIIGLEIETVRRYKAVILNQFKSEILHGKGNLSTSESECRDSSLKSGLGVEEGEVIVDYENSDDCNPLLSHFPATTSSVGVSGVSGAASLVSVAPLADTVAAPVRPSLPDPDGGGGGCVGGLGCCVFGVRCSVGGHGCLEEPSHPSPRWGGGGGGGGWPCYPPPWDGVGGSASAR
jgi:hypothetical protein